MEVTFSPQNYLTTGSFGEKKIPYRFDFSGEKGIIIFFHGLASSPFGSSETNHSWLFQYFRDQNYSVAMYESSRNEPLPELLGDFEALKHHLFAKKTLTDEVIDAEEFVTFIFDQCKKNHGESKTFSTHFVGFSLGGLIATLLTPLFDPSSISLLGSSSHFSLPDNTPIIGSEILPPEKLLETVQAVASIYTGKVCLIRGSEDDTAPLKGSEKLFSCFSQANMKSFVHLMGVNHRFRNGSGEVDKRLLRRLSVILSSQFVLK